jgi:hypothetical protein
MWSCVKFALIVELWGGENGGKGKEDELLQNIKAIYTLA